MSKAKPTTYGDLIKAHPDDPGIQRLKAAIEADQRALAQSEATLKARRCCGQHA